MTVLSIRDLTQEDVAAARKAVARASAKNVLAAIYRGGHGPWLERKMTRERARMQPASAMPMFGGRRTEPYLSEVSARHHVTCGSEMLPALPIERSDVELHGQRYTYCVAGTGPLVVLLHGIAASSATWEMVIPRIADQYSVIAPDLLGHGQSAKPSGDYSLGAYANLVRDLLEVLGRDRCTLVGHSLGGGVAMQFCYQFPERCDRLVLVSTGGLGRDLHPLLRAAALPGADVVLPWLSVVGSRAIGKLVKTMGKVGFRASTDLAETWRSFVSLEEPAARTAFLQTVKGIIDLGGQRIIATDRLYLSAELPTMVIWGERDPLIPVAHAQGVRAVIPSSRIEIFPATGHYPHLEDPERFALLLLDFIRTTQPSPTDPIGLRRRLRAGAGAPSVP